MPSRHPVLSSLTAGGVLAATLLFGGTAFAQAPVYPPSSSNVVLPTASSFAPGQSFPVTVSGFAPGSQVSLELHSVTVPLGSFTANANGMLVRSIALPANFPAGSHELVAAGTSPSGAPVSFQAAFVVAAPGQPGPANSPRSVQSPTGSVNTGGGGTAVDGGSQGDSTAILLGGAALALVAGGGIVGVARARRR